jgi:hypothetical protein
MSKGRTGPAPLGGWSEKPKTNHSYSTGTVAFSMEDILRTMSDPAVPLASGRAVATDLLEAYISEIRKGRPSFLGPGTQKFSFSVCYVKCITPKQNMSNWS